MISLKPDPGPAGIDRSVASLTSFVYFVQGALSLSAVAFPLFLREKGWSVSEIASFSFVIGLPWTLKLLYGAFSDGFPLQGSHRKSYVILASLFSIAAWIGLAASPYGRALVYFWGILANLGFAVTDVVTDALIVENSNESTTQFYQSLAWGFRSFGAVAGGFLGGWLAQNLPDRLIFALMALLPLSTLLVGLGIRESPRAPKEGRIHLLRPILESLRLLFKGDLLWFSLFLLSGSFSASFSTPFFFHLKEKLSFSETFLGSLSSLTWLGAIVGCFIYGKFFKNFSLKKSLALAVALNVLTTLGVFLILDRSSAVLLAVSGGVLGYLALLPLMGAAAVLSRHPGIEGSLFALIMSVHNLGQLLSIFVGGRLFDIMGLAPLIILSALVGLTGFFFVSRLKNI